ncbi:MAG: hypothetical protein VB055_08390 [Oscillospiraceae bacterium]|nr:hypothetical protein [Oscillospiraceae bacterium]
MSRSWFRLDNAALIFPAVRGHNWTNVFRESITLTEPVDPVLLQQAVEDLMPRFPSLYVRLRSGAFWYFLESVRQPPTVRQDFAYPLTHMAVRELHTCCIRIFYHNNRVAVEFFHSLTDGSGALVYLKTLTARYLSLRYQLEIPADCGVLDFRQPPSREELEDSFLRYSGRVALSRREQNAYQLRGTREHDGFLHLVTGILETKALVDTAHQYHATVTAFLAAVMTQAILDIQRERHYLGRKKPVKITIPVNLRRLYGSGTLRNFALTINPGIDPMLGRYSLAELCQIYTHQLALEATPQLMASRIAANVMPQRLPLMKIAPLGVKNLVMRGVYAAIGERKGCLNISNLGSSSVPEAMRPYVARLEFIIGVQKTYPNNCSVASCGDVTCINMIRNIEEPTLERNFFSHLVELGIPVTIESNER